MSNKATVDSAEKRMRGSLAVVKLGEASEMSRQFGADVRKHRQSAEDRTVRLMAEEMATARAKKKAR
jgi:hypothetical protein